MIIENSIENGISSWLGSMLPIKCVYKAIKPQLIMFSLELARNVLLSSHGVVSPTDKF